MEMLAQKHKKLVLQAAFAFQNVTAVDPMHISWNTVNYPKGTALLIRALLILPIANPKGSAALNRKWSVQTTAVP